MSDTPTRIILVDGTASIQTDGLALTLKAYVPNTVPASVAAWIIDNVPTARYGDVEDTTKAKTGRARPDASPNGDDATP